VSIASVRRAVIRIGAVLFFLVLAGATYQGVATAFERRQFRHPGRLVDVGGHQLHIYCIGNGSPTVVLEAGAAGMSAAWGWVQPAIAKVTRVCSYDRAGLGWSEAGDRSYDPAAVAPALNTLLDRSGEHAPFVLAGHGLGAAFATLYAASFRDTVAALVLIDPPAAMKSPEAGTSVSLVNASPWLARTGVLRAWRMLSTRARGLPPQAGGALSAFLNRPDHLTRSARELARWDETVAMAQQAAVGEDLAITRVTPASSGKVAFLTDAAQASAVTDAVLAAVTAARATQ
jgi:pimeloyl-ACP methyl ester carboxylesterase